MKILELRFKNLNSLQGEWHIDFTDSAYQMDGIFALTGPTGAGKSTILDAICLALYGQTPRLGSITKTDNEIMSRHTADCYAEVRFVSQAGEFLCRFDQRRARNAITGALQDPKHEISDAQGKILESKRSKVPAVVEEKTGMDFKRFTRSILLAQGQFDGFLKANSDEKSQILEQLTGTEIYAELSQSVYERWKAEDQALNQLTASADAVQLLSPEEAIELKSALNEHTATVLGLKDHLAHIQQAIAWQKECSELTQQITTLRLNASHLSEKMAAFAPEKTRLAKALQAQNLEGMFDNLRALRQDQAIDDDNLKKYRAELPLQQSACAQYQNNVNEKAQTHQALLLERKGQEALWEQVQALDQALDALHERMMQTAKKQMMDTEYIADLTRQIATIEAAMTDVQQQCAAAETHLKAHPHDGALVEVLPRIRILAEEWQKYEKKMMALTQVHSKQQLALSFVQTELNEQAAAIESAAVNHAAAESALAAAKAALIDALSGRTLKDHQREKEHWLREQSLNTTIASYEAARARLKANEPCPLCGSTEHPYVTMPAAMSDAEAHIARITATIELIETRMKAEQQADKALHAATSILQSAEADGAMKQMAVQHAHVAVNESAAQLDELKQSMAAALEDWQAEMAKVNVKAMDRDLALSQLTERKNAWAAAESTLKIAAEQLEPLRAEIAALIGQKDARTVQLAALEDEVKALQMQCNEKMAARASLFGEENVASVKAAWHENLTAQQTALEDAKALHQQAVQSVMRLEERIMNLVERMATRAEKITAVTADFTAAHHEAGFTSEDAVLAAMLPKAERIALQEKADALTAEVAENTLRLTDGEERLAALVQLNLTTEPLETLTADFDAAQFKIDALNQTVGRLQKTLNDDEQAKATLATTAAAIDVQKNERDRWKKLNMLIGSADGKKYRTFAQGLTFELMVRQANQELMKMSDRYLLVRDEKEALQLNVIDNYQAGEVRSTKNLSGGESFIVSLALALGLSKMASRKVRVDSLFLDEGFGTLDEDALDTALALLSNLQGEGKLIGIISHVSALKERITTQIQIQPKNGGKSIIIGPGCTKLESSCN